jgi:H+/Cl- antiporter ClcA
LHFGKNSHLNFALATVLVGVAAGLGGMALGLLLHLIQHVAYGYGFDAPHMHESFLEGVTAASPLRRVLALITCGALGGIGWWTLFRFGDPLVSVNKAIGDEHHKMPMFSTTVHSVLQIVTVALGSPLGRESAPRELAASLAYRISDRFQLSADGRRIMIACGAGAGLAAVYNVPLGGALFTLEVLLGSFALRCVLPALATSVIATLIAWIGLGNAAPYSIPPLAISPSLVVWSVVTGPFFGLSAFAFRWAVDGARESAPRDWRLIVWCGLVMPAIGLLSIPFPQLLGNGKGMEQMGLDNLLSPGFAAILFLLKLLVTASALRAGMTGGLLTPGLALGGTFGIVLGAFWSHAWPSVPGAEYAIVGSAAFLASSAKMPLTAMVLIVEFTRVGHDFLIPISLAIVGSVAVSQFCVRRTTKGIKNATT